MPSAAVPDNILSEIRHYAAQATTAITLRELYEFGRGADNSTIIRAAQFLQHEMPIRLAKKVIELENIPGGLSNTRWIKVVRDWYVQSFIEFIEHPPVKNIEDDRAFSAVISQIKERHKNQVAVMARGLHEFMNREGISELDSEIQSFLDSFYLSRIGIRVLLGHHAALHENKEGWVGIICAQTSVLEVAQEAALNASNLCRQIYGDPPEVKFHGRLNLRFKYIPSHLHHMLFELLKNSFRATVETHGHSDRLPSIHIVIAGGLEDVSIKISDAGGGIPRSAIDRVFNYSYTTARSSSLIAQDTQGTIMAGLGYGLPLCRLYARYFGGDLRLISLEGFGTDAFLHLSRIGTHGEYIL